MPAKYARKNQADPPKKKRRRGNAITTIPDYDDDELEFLKAIEKYKRDKGKLFPTYTECLAVLKSLGYRKVVKNNPTTEGEGGQTSSQASRSRKEQHP